MADATGWAAAELAARTSYGRLVAYLAARTGDVAAAEDALADAFVRALETWPRDGVPANPDAWLYTAARRRMLDGFRRETVARQAWPDLAPAVEAAESGEFIMTDQRLALLFVCGHPAIQAAARTPLMLQTVLGLDAARIAGAFLVSPSSMSQRLVRAKAKIREAGIRFQLPEARDLPERLEFVLDAIYAAFTAGWDTAPLASQGGDLAEEAIWLGRMVVEQLPEAAEARGLLALMLHCHARRAARRDANGRFVPLDEQDPREWSLALILEAEQQLRTAASYRVIGHYQLEAAIQSAHAAGAARGKKDWAAITGLYQGLLRIAPSLGAEVAYCAALRHTEGPAGALARLLDLEESRVAGYQPYWALRGQLARDSGDVEGAAAAYRRALALTEDPAVRDFLQGALQEARDGGSH